MKKKKKGVYPFIWRWVISYILVFFIPLIFGFMIYNYAHREIENQIENSYIQRINHLESTISVAFDTVNGRCWELLNQVIDNSIIYADEFDSVQRQFLPEIQRNMFETKSGNNYISELYIYLPRSDYMITDSVVYEYSGISDVLKVQNGLTDREFSQIIEKEKKYGYFYISESENHSAFLINGTKDAVILARLDSQVLIEQMEMMESDTCLVDDNNRMLTVDGWTEESLPAISDSGKYHVYDQGSEYIVSIPVSGENCRIVNIIPMSQYLQSLNQFKKLIYIYFGICVLIGIGAIIYFLRKNYNPLKEIADAIMDDRSQLGDYSAVQKRIRKLVQENKTYERYVEEYQTNKMKDAVLMLIKNVHADESEPLDQMKKLQDNLSGKKLVLVVIELEEDTGPVTQEKDARALLRFIAGNVAEELLREKYDVYTAQEGQNVYCLVYFSDDFDEIKVIETITDKSRQLVSMFKVRAGESIFVNISRVYYSLADFSHCWDEMMDLEIYKEFKNDVPEVLVYADIEQENDWQTSQQRIWLNIERAIHCKNYVEAENLVQNLKIEKIQKESSLDEKSGPRMNVEDIKAYIADHYREESLNVSSISDHFHINVSYLSQFFKKKIGMGVLDYIVTLRIEDAKKLLAEGYTVTKTAEMVGYANTRPLIRAFKRIEGMTPSEFMENLKNQS